MRAQLEELSMLLRNDAVEGSDVVSMHDADRLYLLTKHHAERLQETFGLAHGVDETAQNHLEVPDAFREALGRIVPPYLAIGNALAADNPQAVAQAIGKLRQVAGSIDASPLSGATADRWAVEKENLAKIITRLASATDLARQRSAFALLSDELLTLHYTFGIANSDELFELHCPMAFEGRGASWVQADKQVRNPYYGASMLKCADQIQPLKLSQETMPAQHSGHNH